MHRHGGQKAALAFAWRVPAVVRIPDLVNAHSCSVVRAALSVICFIQFIRFVQVALRRNRRAARVALKVSRNGWFVYGGRVLVAPALASLVRLGRERIFLLLAAHLGGLELSKELFCHEVSFSRVQESARIVVER